MDPIVDKLAFSPHNYRNNASYYPIYGKKYSLTDPHKTIEPTICTTTNSNLLRTRLYIGVRVQTAQLNKLPLDKDC